MNQGTSLCSVEDDVAVEGAEEEDEEDEEYLVTFTKVSMYH